MALDELDVEGGGAGVPRANAREEEEVLNPGGGGVGYELEGAVR